MFWRESSPGISLLYKGRVFCIVNKMSLTAVTQPLLSRESVCYK